MCLGYKSHQGISALHCVCYRYMGVGGWGEGPGAETVTRLQHHKAHSRSESQTEALKPGPLPHEAQTRTGDSSRATPLGPQMLLSRSTEDSRAHNLPLPIFVHRRNSDTLLKPQKSPIHPRKSKGFSTTTEGSHVHTGAFKGLLPPPAHLHPLHRMQIFSSDEPTPKCTDVYKGKHHRCPDSQTIHATRLY